MLRWRPSEQTARMRVTLDRLPLSLIIPVYGRPQLLERALGSLLEQSVPPAEVIVVDDGSPDPTRVSAPVAGRLNLRIVRHERNLGAAAARNTGMRAAEKEWISFLDSDDVLLPDSLTERWTLVQQDQRERADPTIVYGCGWIERRKNGDLRGIRWPRPSRSALDFASGCWFSPGSCVILNRDAALAAAGEQDVTLRRFEDYDWYLSLAQRGWSLASLPVCGVVIDRHRSQVPATVEQTAQSLIAKWQRLLTEPAFLDRIRAYMALEVAAAYYFRGFRIAGALHLARSMAAVPRLSLQLSPAWDIEPVTDLPDRVLRRRL